MWPGLALETLTHVPKDLFIWPFSYSLILHRVMETFSRGEWQKIGLTEQKLAQQGRAISSWQVNTHGYWDIYSAGFTKYQLK